MISRNIHYFHQAFLNAQKAENRRGGRFHIQKVSSSLGRVIDLSSCGALVRKKRLVKKPAGGVFILTISDTNHRIRLKARIVRQNKLQAGGTVLGIEFVEMSEEQRHTLHEIIRNGRDWEVIKACSGSAERSPLDVESA